MSARYAYLPPAAPICRPLRLYSPTPRATPDDRHSSPDRECAYRPTPRQVFASDEALFKRTLAAAWSKLLEADRFDGPTGNLCHNHGARPSPPSAAAEAA